MRSVHIFAGTLIVLLILAMPSAAQSDLQFKELGGPATEIPDLRPADPASTTTSSRTALLPVTLQQHDGQWSWSDEVPSEGGTLRLIVFSDPKKKPWRLVQPDIPEGESVQVSLGEEAVLGRLYELHDSDRAYTGVRIESDTEGRGFLLLDAGGGAVLHARQVAFNQLAGERIGFVAWLTSGDGPPIGVAGSVRLRVTRRDHDAVDIVEAPMVDDGEHNDRDAGDGVYGGTFSADRPGDYFVKVIYSGHDGCTSVLRTTEHLVPVLPRGLWLKENDAIAVKRSPHRLEVRIPTSGSGTTAHYRVLAEVWGTVGDTLEPIAWIGGLTAPREGMLPLGLDTRWITRAGAHGPFELRNVRVEDPNHFITVTSQQMMRLSVPDLPPGGSEPGMIDEEMRMGPRPETQERAVPVSYPPEVAHSGHKLLLVHGYCSGNVWGTVAARQFPDAAVFRDFVQNRTIDEFAFGIRVWAKSQRLNSYAIVAHSQGGMAALHLYTFYRSGLDNTGPGRLIQSVGTPYQGTRLAAFMAEVGAIFGAGCGSNYDLTYEGAAQWLAGISPFHRARVSYYTTAFKDDFGYDYCNPITDRLLADPEDGVVEVARGHLPGGVHGGNTRGWCHTVHMKQPAQYQDTNRNKVMRQRAAGAPP
jgi:hypothetical protein